MWVIPEKNRVCNLKWTQTHVKCKYIAEDIGLDNLFNINIENIDFDELQIKTEMLLDKDVVNYERSAEMFVDRELNNNLMYK